MEESARDWAFEQFATASFGDARRHWRAAQMLRRAAERPAGRLSEVFESEAELQAAYDFVESDLAPSAIVSAFADATLRAATDEDVFVVVDGTSLSLTDRTKTKDFGSVGSRRFPTRGVKLIDAIAIDHAGAPLGVLDVHAWTRGEKATDSRFARRAAGDNETRHWVEVIERVSDRVRGVGRRPWFVIDREGDCADILRAVSASGARFTIRASQDRLIWSDGPRQSRLRRSMQRKPVLATRVINLCRRESRPARKARLDVRVARIKLDLPNYRNGSREAFEVSIVWARERTAPRGQEPVDWMLLTNERVADRHAAMRALDVYCFRWRIEDFHRAWKRGACRVEETQLRRRDHVVRWATMLAAVAARVERLKHLARTQPNAPASIELTPLELTALRIKKKRIKKRTEPDPEAMPTIATAVLWIGQCGSYHGKPTKLPGAICIARGLERLMPFVEGLRAGLELAREK